MSPQDLLDHFGTKSNIARAFHVKPPSVAEWFAKGEVPIGRQYQAEVLTGGKLQADPLAPVRAEELRPN